jgi:hypothetical protein
LKETGTLWGYLFSEMYHSVRYPKCTYTEICRMVEVRTVDLHKILYAIVLLEMFNTRDVFLSLISYHLQSVWTGIKLPGLSDCHLIWRHMKSYIFIVYYEASLQISSGRSSYPITRMQNKVITYRKKLNEYFLKVLQSSNLWERQKEKKITFMRK